MVAAALAVPVDAGSLLTVNPTGASPGVPIQVTGSGFNTTASANIVTFSPAGGPAIAVPATAIATVDANQGIRRLNVVVPSLPPGPAGLRVTNAATGGISEGLTLDVLELSLPDITSAPVGTAGLQVALLGSSETDLTGTPPSRVSFGAGVTVRAVTIESPRRLIATIDVASTAAPGPRSVAIRPLNQYLLAANAFTITPAGSPNRAPAAAANGPYQGLVNQSVTLSSAGSTDPDGDPLSFAWTFGDGSTSTDPNPTHSYATAGTFTVTLLVSDGRGGSSTASTSATIAAAPVNHDPVITSQPVLTAVAGQPYVYQVMAVDEDGDALAYALETSPAGMSIDAASGSIAWTPQAGQAGDHPVTVRVSDGHAGSALQSYTVHADGPVVTLTGIAADPTVIRFSAAGATRALTVTGRRSDDTVADLTAPTSGTTYASSNAFVAGVDPSGVVTAVANGDATITARNGALTATTSVTVEIGVTLLGVELGPASAILRQPGAVQALTLTGHFSDGSARNLTTAPGADYRSSDSAIARVDAGGAVSGVANGTATITASYAGAEATSQIRVEFAQAGGFVRGVVFDDSRGLPLQGATIDLLADGNGPAAPGAASTVSDDRGRFVLPAVGGDAVVRISKAGFTTVDRRGSVPGGGAVRLLDARLTPLDSRATPLRSVFGGRAEDASGLTTLDVAAGALNADVSAHITPIGPQGLAGRLPLGWSPVGGVDVEPAGVPLSVPAQLVVPNTASLSAGTDLVIALYDPTTRQWLAAGTTRVSTDARTIPIALGATGQIALLIGDASPFVPPAPVAGQPLEGVQAVSVPDQATGSGDVIPRSAPPGAGARAIGRVGLQSPVGLPSGTPIQVRVNEQFDMTDTSTVVPLPFTQDIFVHARPRPPTGGALGASFAVSPSRTHTIQELLHGVVNLTVTRPTVDANDAVAGPQGTIVTSAEGDLLTIPAGALDADTLVRLTRVAPDSLLVPVPSGLELISALDVDLVNASFGAPAGLSVPRPAGVQDTDQILVAVAFVDPTGVRRLRIVAAATPSGDRLVATQAIGSLTLAGIVGGGEYLLLKPAQPLGFIAGGISGPGGAPAALTLVTGSSAPFADLTAADGRYVIAGQPGIDTQVAALNLVTRDFATAIVRVTARDAVSDLSLGLALVPPTVTGTSPASGAAGVPLDASIAIDFSTAIDPASLTDHSVVLQAGAAAVAVTRTLSQDQRRLVLRPASPLAGKTTFTLTLTGAVRNTSGASLAGFAPVSFATLDPDKPVQPDLGRIVASLPDVDGFVLVFGNGGSAQPGSAVTGTTERTQETITVIALNDGSFRFRLSALIGDAIDLTLRDASGRETTVPLTQFVGDDGTTSIGPVGGRVEGPDGRVITALPRALTTAGLFKLDTLAAASAPPLPASFSYADHFSLNVEGAAFNRLASLSLTEGQNRFAPATAADAPFGAAGQLTVPLDILVNSSLRFTALAQDAGGTRRTVTAATSIVPTAPGANPIESSYTADFPNLFVVAPPQAAPGEVVGVTAIAPLARLELSEPAPPAQGDADQFLLTKLATIGGAVKLQVLDSLQRLTAGAGQVLATTGHGLPGMSTSGEYAIVHSAGPLVLVTGRLTGPPAAVTVDGLPFVFVTESPNAAFALPVPANQSFVLHFVTADGTLLGSVSGQAPASGSLDLGNPLGTSTGQLRVSVEPDDTSIVDIGQPLVLRFSEPVDSRTLSGSAVLVTDAAGIRVFGTMTASGDGLTATFRPARRWRLGATYRYGISTSVLAMSGAKLAQAVSGRFTTFAPKVLTSLREGVPVDVGTAGAIGLLATDAGAALFDATSPAAPATAGRIGIPGGGRAAALNTLPSLVDRNGAALGGPFGVVATGDAVTGARIGLYSLATPAAPLLLGSAQLAAAQGQAVPPGVLPSAGVPQEIATAGDRAWVAIENAGLVSVRLGALAPDDPSNPGQALGPHYPATGSESVTSVAALNDRLVLAGASGLTILDAVTLERRGRLSTGAALKRVAAVSQFPIDLNGDGTIASDTEVLDLALAAGGADGTLQFFRVPASGDPTLLSVVRFTGETTSVAINREERLAYVGLGTRGVAVVDLDGPASVQPLDADRDGADDRILGTLAKPGSSARIAFASAGRVADVADGFSGLTVIQVLPPRTTFQSVSRDPVRARDGDEASILDTRTAFTTDEAVQVTINAVVPPGSSLALSLDEAPDGTGPRRLSFADGALVSSLADGLNTVTVLIRPDPSPAGSHATLRVRTATGAQVSFFEFDVIAPGVLTSAVRSLSLTPESIVIGADQDRLQLAVSGVLADGRTVNLTAASSGTTYLVANPLVALVTPDGLLVPLAGGTTEIQAVRDGQVAVASVRVLLAPVLQTLAVRQTHLTLTALGSTGSTGVVAQFTDGSSLSDLHAIGTLFESSDTSVATVDANGVITAVGAGVAVITMRNGAIITSVEVAVEPRSAAVLSSIHLAPPAPTTTDEASVEATATVAGSGSLEGLTVTFTAGAGTPVHALTNYDGIAVARIDGLTAAGQVTLVAAVVNPAGGAQLTDSRTIAVSAGGADAEPNDTIGAAIPMKAERPIEGSIGAGDSADVYRFDQSIGGTLTARLSLLGTSDPAAVTLRLLAPDGTALGQQTPSTRTAALALPIAAGTTYVEVRTSGAAVTYSLSLEYTQGPVTLSGVAPLSGAPGTAVTIDGTGFSLDRADVRVLFGGIVGTVTATTASRINAVVPANAVDGPITVIVSDRRQAGPLFNAGHPGPRAPITLRPATAPVIRFDPITRQRVDVTRLTVSLDPVSTPEDAATLAAALGGEMVGQNPVLSSYVLEFAGVTTLEGMAGIARQLAAMPNVTRVSLVSLSQLMNSTIDARDLAGNFAGTSIPLAIAYLQARVFDAIQAIRETPPFVDFGAAFQPVKIAVIDSGFSPFTLSDFQSAGQNLVRLYLPDANGVYTPQTPGIGPASFRHGTAVTSVIASLNNGVGRVSGGFGSLFQPDEANFHVDVFGAVDDTGSLWSTAIMNALTEIASGGDTDVVNMSLVAEWPGPGPNYAAALGNYRDAFSLMGGKTLIVAAAGNDGIQARFSLPSALEMELPNVMGIGATAVANIDGSGEGADERAVFLGSALGDTAPPCSIGLASGGSNCGPGVTMAAPGEDVLVAINSAPGFATLDGTSFAAPMVSAVAALLKAIGPATGLTPDLLRTLLVDSGDDITATWGTGQSIRRLNALNAVRLLLPSSAAQMIYVADQSADNGGTALPGRIVGIDIDPLTGLRPTPPNPDVVIPLTFTKTTADGTFAFAGSQPTSLAIEPGGERLFAVVKGGAALGDGLLVVNTHSNTAVDFIPFSGSGFPASGSASPVFAPNLRPGMVFSKDGRLLYVAAGTGIVIVNTVEGRVVKSFGDLPAIYKTHAGSVPGAPLADRLSALTALVTQGITGRPGFSLSALALSPDGRILYGAVNTGGGGGQQPGGLLAFNVDTYSDAKPDEPGLQSDLTGYLLPLTANGAVPMLDAGGFLGGDEPGALAVSADGQHVYMVNGGLNFFEAIPAADLDLAKYNFLLIGPAMGIVGAPGGIGGVIAATSGFMNTANQLYNSLVVDIREQAKSGLTFVSAPGVTGVFDGASGSGSTVAETWLYPSELSFGWRPSPANGGLLVNQFRFGTVFAKRPFDMGMRPDGRRALVPFFQTGNFGILDLDAQAGFLAPPGATANPDFASLPADQFQGVVAVTPALRLDNHVWPSRGAFRSGDLVAPSPDEHRLFAWHAEYAQNGRFAVASHAGNDAPRTVTATIPDFIGNIENRLQLSDLGGAFQGATMTIVEDGQTLTVVPGDTVQLKRGGGAISIIDDARITAELAAHAQETITAENGTVRPFLATAPICGVRNAGNPTRCDTDPTTTLIDYTTSSGPVRFHRPRGITVEPFVVFDQPRFGDHAGKSTSLQIVWRDARVRQLSVTLLDPATPDASGQPSVIGQLGGALTGPQIDAMTAAVRFGDLFPAATPPVQGRSYIVEAHASIDTPQVEELSRTSIQLVFDDQSAPPRTDELQLRPFLVPVVTVPSAQGSFRQLTVTLKPADGSTPVDVTSSADTTYLWLGDLTGQVVGTSNPSVNRRMDLDGIDVSGIVNTIKSKLRSAGVPVDFKIADITVDSAGHLRVDGAGLQIVEAIHIRNGSVLPSAPILVLAGIQLTGIDLEPDSLLTDVASVTGAETLAKKLAGKLGKKVNTPLILSATDPVGFSFLSNKGAIDLEDVEFTFLGTWKIGIGDLVAAIEPIVRKRLTQALGGPLTATGQIGGRLGAKAISLLLNEAITEATLQFVDLKSADPAVASVVNDTFSGTAFKGTVTATGSGIGAIKGELSLGGFGSADDAVPVWVLPNLTQVIVEPTNTVICSADSPLPGPRIHTFASLKLAERASITPGQLGFSGDAAKLADALIPAFLPTGTFYDTTFTIGDFKFGFSGTVNVEADKITWLEPTFRFYVPNIPGVTNRYELFPPGNPQATGTVSAQDPELFAVHLVHSHIAGKNQINNFVQIPGLGSVQGIGSVTVTDLCSTPFVLKESTSGVQTAAPGDQLSYVVTVGNPTLDTVENVTINETATYFAGVPTGDPAQDAIEVTQVIPVGTLPPQSSIAVPVLIQAFGNAPGTIQNRATATGTRPFVPVDPCHFDPTGPGCEPPRTPCDINPDGPGCRRPSDPPPYCATHPTDPKCVCAAVPTPEECKVRPKPIPVAPAAPFITEMVLAPQRDWNDTTGGNGVPFDGQPGTATPDGGDLWIEVTSLTAATNWTLKLTDATGATFSKFVGPPVIGSAVTVVSGFGVGTSPIVKVEVIDQNGVNRQTVDVAAIESALGHATGLSDEALAWSIYGSPTPVLQQFLRRPATIRLFNPF